MTASAFREQIDLERHSEKMKQRGRGRWCLPLFNYHQSVLDSPAFQNRETNFSQLLLDPTGRIPLFF